MLPISEKLLVARPLAAYLLVITLAVALYAQTTRFQFTLDDPLVTTLSSQVGNFKTNDLATLFSSHFYAGSGNVGSNNSNLYRPVAKLSFVLDYLLAGRKFTPASFHLTNVILYALLCAVVLRFLRRLMPDAPLTTFCMAMVFTVLPAHTEVVANIKHREEMLSLLFALSAWIAATSGRGKAAVRALLATTLFLLALLSKESALLLLPLFFLGEYVFRDRRLQLRPLLLAAAPLAVYFFLRFKALGALFSPEGTATFFLAGEGLPIRLLTSAWIFTRYYLWDQLVTQQLNPSFSHYFILQPEQALTAPHLLSLALCLALAVSSLIASLWRKSVAGYWLFFFFCSAGLATNVIPIGTAGAFRLIFTPSLGLSAFVVAVIAGICRLTAGASAHSLPRREAYRLLAVCLPLIAFYGYQTFTRAGIWKNNYTLFAYAAGVDSQNPLSSYEAGNFSGEGIGPVKIGHFANALRQYSTNERMFTKLDERNLVAYATMATETAFYSLESDPLAALALADTGVRVFSRLAVVRGNRPDSNAPAPYYVKALAEYRLGRREASLQTCREGLSIHSHEGLSRLQEKIAAEAGR